MNVPGTAHQIMVTPGNGTDERGAAAEYVASMVSDLAQIARRHGFDTLGYILEMAKLEAENQSGSSCGKS
jgi:hypothetical protein